MKLREKTQVRSLETKGATTVTIPCTDALDMLGRFREVEVAAYNAYLRKYRDNGIRRDREHRSSPAGLARAAPNWTSQDLAGRRVPVIGENGPGDEILTLGCLADLRACCKEVVWQCTPKLRPLLCQSFPDVQFIGTPDVPVEFDLVVHAWQLIGRFRPSLQSFAWTASGLFSPYIRGKHLRGGRTSTPCIGLAWHSEGGKLGKSCDLDLVPGWATFFGALRKRARFVSLQHGETPEALQALQDTIAAVGDRHDVAIEQDPRVDTFNDFCGLAAQVAGLDCVVSISTTVAHLAGALGIPGWVPLPDKPIPHWQAGQHVCVWYPTLHPVPHEKPGDWDSALATVTRRLMAAQRAWPGRPL